MYARSAFGLQEGHVASLRSPEYDISTLECGACRLGFWYHMHGSDIGRLEVGLPKIHDMSDIHSILLCFGRYLWRRRFLPSRSLVLLSFRSLVNREMSG